MKQIIQLVLTLFVMLVLFSCIEQTSTKSEKMPLASVKTTHLRLGDIQSQLTLNGKTTYLKKNVIVSPIAGYVVEVSKIFGERVHKNEVLFKVQTKEGRALENGESSNSKLGIIGIPASSDGVISELMINEPGGFVSEGSVLCQMLDINDLLIQVNMPFKNNELIKLGTPCILHLSDNTTFSGKVVRILPTIDETNQTQNILIKPETTRSLPENLNLSVSFVDEKLENRHLVEKSAVMTNETQNKFWVMKIVDSNMAIRVPIFKGLENDSLVEIRTSSLNANDLIINEGAYGLPDSTLVTIVK